ncbi:hypothetical protein [Paractinoplanes globisporus]|uniref:Uncharacterized protein n=1 Tax=Paractinoplanes globisporus TaxID=113565 RepID=A0ABW6WM31_9ACTN|nr:hypothetical protein [Actinoplanes globisporus]
MDESVWLAISVAVLVVVVVGGGLVVVRRRRARATDDPETRKREAGRRAIEQMDKGRRRGRKGTIRGQGGGGDEKTQQDAGYGTDFDGGI